MNVDPTISREKIRAALDLLMEETTTVGKFERIKTLASGANPKIDKTLSEISSVIKNLQKIETFDVIDLTLTALPDQTDKDKKRKKLLLEKIKRL